MDRASVDVGEESMYDGQWIGIGSKAHVTRYKKYTKLPTPLTQKNYFNGKSPFIKNKNVLIRQLHVSVTLLLNESRIINEQDEDHEWYSDKMNGKLSGSSSNSSCMKNKNVDEVNNLDRFLDDFKEGKRTKEDTMKLLTAAVIEMIEARDSVKSNCIGSILDLNNQLEVQELIKDPLLKMKKVPTLSQLHIPIDPLLLSVIIKEIASLSHMFPNRNILQYTNDKVSKIVCYKFHVAPLKNHSIR